MAGDSPIKATEISIAGSAVEMEIIPPSASENEELHSMSESAGTNEPSPMSRRLASQTRITDQRKRIASTSIGDGSGGEHSHVEHTDKFDEGTNIDTHGRIHFQSELRLENEVVHVDGQGQEEKDPEHWAVLIFFHVLEHIQAIDIRLIT